MIKSMTGYGRGRYENDGREFLVEIKSVNHKYHDINIKLPRSISFLEEVVKKRINEVVNRGKIDIYISYTNFSQSDKEVKIDEDLAKNYITAFQKMAQDVNLSPNISVLDIAQLPDVINIVDKQDEEKLKQELNFALEEAISNFLSMRKIEGQRMAEDLQERMKNISKNLETISKLSTGLVDEYIVKLKERIKEILKDNVIDENRIAMEAVIYADKTSIQEELTRLRSHILQFQDMLLEDKAVGKKLDFLIQEMNRETNTIASKANCLEITQTIVEIKNELENVREQVQNIE